ncbi:hypothetical protein XM47_06120 [Catenovulum maritimum]|uniref:Uncharacterized protein n=2 Tax=Catenovulum maritimum TaxID=1513271 RepID=A0A0J8GTG1_9ALTE|nr:hypothetical protein XM47_06120 [Catenovulum maritimum]
MQNMPDWLAQYLKNADQHDEVEHYNGGNSEHWDILFNKFSNLNSKDILLRTNEIKRLIQDAVATKTQDSEALWQLDPMPMMISDCDWKTIV